MMRADMEGVVANSNKRGLGEVGDERKEREDARKLEDEKMEKMMVEAQKEFERAQSTDARLSVFFNCFANARGRNDRKIDAVISQVEVLHEK